MSARRDRRWLLVVAAVSALLWAAIIRGCHEVFR
jgi:hypothetical protein